MIICEKSATNKEPSNTRLNPYDRSTRAQMISFYQLLSEKNKHPTPEGPVLC